MAVAKDKAACSVARVLEYMVQCSYATSAPERARMRQHIDGVMVDGDDFEMAYRHLLEQSVDY